MNLGKAELIKKQADKQFIDYVKSLKIESNPNHPALQKVIECLQNYVELLENPLSIKDIFAPFDFSNSVPKTKSRLCGGILKKGDRAYKCHECLNEDNSILCMQCFDLQKHKGHQFELIQVYGGCCDCGDPEKWNKDGFCQEHSSNQISNINIEGQILQEFLYTHKYLFSIMLYYYHSFIQRYNSIKKKDYSAFNLDQKELKSLLDMFKKKAVHFLENSGCIFVNQLIAFNKNGQYANKMTNQFLKATMNLKEFPFLQNSNLLSEFEGKSILSLCFTFVEFHKLPQVICDLFITLFQLRGFREIITIQYMDNYHKNPHFLVSNYTHLSSQLFTSYITISQIVQEKKISPISINLQALQKEDVQVSSQSYVRFYYDVGYLSKLFGDASIDYFRFHAANNAMTNLCGYCKIFNLHPSSIDYYGMDEIFIVKMFQLIKVIQRDQSKFIFKISLRDYYRQITSSQMRSDNYYRPQQRFFALLAFAYFEGDLSQLDNEENMVEFLATIFSDNLESEIKTIVKRICTVFSFAASLLENQKRTSDYYTFYSFYFKKTSNLFNLDSILMKIVVKMFDFYNRHTESTISLTKMVQNGDMFFDMYNKMTNFSNDRSTMKTQRQIGQSIDVLRPQHFKHFIFYLSLINEAITSDLPILAMSCILQPKKEQAQKYYLPIINYNEQAEFYYRNILKSCENSKISIKDFKKVCDSFFVQEEVFKNFVNSYQDESDKRRLNAQKCKGFKLSPIFFKSIHHKIIGIDHYGDMGVIPYFYKDLSLNVFAQNVEVIWRSAEAYINNSLIAHQNECEGSSKAIITNLFNMTFTFLWTLYVQNKDIKIITLLIQQIKKYKLQQALPYLFKEIQKQISQNVIQKSRQSELSQIKQQMKREKLLSKKQLLNQKMLKNKNNYISSQVKQVEQSHDICCICKQKRQNQILCYIGFTTITNYNGWLDLHPNNIFFQFSTCGHMIHRSCKTNSQKSGKVYNFCHLCRKPTNIIIPKNISTQFFKETDYFIDDLQEILKLFGDQCNIGNMLFKSIVAFLIVKGIVFPKYFGKQINLYSSLFALLRNYYKKFSTFLLKEQISNIQFIFFKNSSNPQQFIQVFDQFTNKLLNFIESGQLKQSEKDSSEISETASYLIKKLIYTQAGAETFIDIQFPLKQRLQKTINYKELPQKLDDFSRNYLGKCPNCGLVTNLQAICLICPNFITCVKCQKNSLNAHSENEHKKTCSFLKTNSGEVIYIYKNRHWIFESLYEDYMGRNYTVGQADKQGYELNKKRLNQYFDDIITCNIEIKLRSKQKQFNKVNIDTTL